MPKPIQPIPLFCHNNSMFHKKDTLKKLLTLTLPTTVLLSDLTQNSLLPLPQKLEPLIISIYSNILLKLHFPLPRLIEMMYFSIKLYAKSTPSKRIVLLITQKKLSLFQTKKLEQSTQSSTSISLLLTLLMHLQKMVSSGKTKIAWVSIRFWLSQTEVLKRWWLEILFLFT